MGCCASTRSLILYCYKRLNEDSDLNEGNPGLPSGRWTGYFDDSRYSNAHDPQGRTWPIDVDITFKNNRSFEGLGEDDVGPFEIQNGTIKGEKCSFLKVYSTHDITYRGVVNGQQLVGQWRLNDSPDVRGDFRMWPDLDA